MYSSVGTFVQVAKGGFQNQKPAKLGTLSRPLKPPSLPLNLGQTSLPQLGQCPKFSPFFILEASLKRKAKPMISNYWRQIH